MAAEPELPLFRSCIAAEDCWDSDGLTAHGFVVLYIQLAVGLLLILPPWKTIFGHHHTGEAAFKDEISLHKMTSGAVDRAAKMIDLATPDAILSKEAIHAASAAPGGYQSRIQFLEGYLQEPIFNSHVRTFKNFQRSNVDPAIVMCVFS